MSQERNYVFVRFADPKQEPVEDWCRNNSARNAFDPSVLSYASTKVLAGHNNGTTFAYMPVQGAAILESIGINPEAKPLDVATAVMEMTKAAILLAQGAGFGEAYFLASDNVTAEGAKRMGFVEMPYKVYRRKI